MREVNNLFSDQVRQAICTIVQINVNATWNGNIVFCSSVHLKSVLRLCLSAQALPGPSTKSNFGKSWYYWLTSTSPSLHRLSKRDNFVKSHPILFPGLSGQEGNPLYLFLTASLRKPDILDFTADCWQAQELVPRNFSQSSWQSSRCLA